MGHLYEKYIWEIPVRATHWVNMLAIVTLSVTGIFIGHPLSIAQNASEYVMGWVRFVHFVAGYTFAISVISRIYWSFATRSRFASWREFVPFLTAEGRKDMLEMFKYYFFMRKTAPHVVGHNALAGATYLLVFGLYLVMILTGFSLYSESAPQGKLHMVLGWMFALSSNQGIRLVHHCGMWLLLAFAIHHVYSAWLMDIKEKGGVMSSIFSGYKPVGED
jgi:Ni/Fe-hydrogenase 1 B-type cytochrome subunit